MKRIDGHICSKRREIPVMIERKLGRGSYAVRYGDGKLGFFEYGRFSKADGTTIFSKATFYKRPDWYREEAERGSA